MTDMEKQANEEFDKYWKENGRHTHSPSKVFVAGYQKAWEKQESNLELKENWIDAHRETGLQLARQVDKLQAENKELLENLGKANFLFRAAREEKYLTEGENKNYKLEVEKLQAEIANLHASADALTKLTDKQCEIIEKLQEKDKKLLECLGMIYAFKNWTIKPVAVNPERKFSETSLYIEGDKCLKELEESE